MIPLLLGLSVLAISAVGIEKPTFRGQSFRVPLDSQVRLPCNVTVLPDSVLVWKQGSRVIFAGGLRVRRDQRFQLDNQVLVISYAKAKDSGVYTCQIESPSKNKLEWLEHLLVVETPPVVYTIQTTVTRLKGEQVELVCNVRGSPLPTVIWGLENRDISGLSYTTSDTGTSLYIRNLTRSYSGNYTCTARNGVGLPISRSIQLNVLYGPEIEVERSIVHSSQGCSASLVCFVSGSPTPEVRWFQNTLLLVPSRDIVIKSTGGRHELILSNVELSSRSVKEYNCTATNSISTTSSMISITGLPEPPSVYAEMEYLGNSEYFVMWTSRSINNIIKHRLTYRQVKENESLVEFGEKTVELLVSKDADAVLNCDERFRNYSYVLHNLEFGVHYEVKVEAYNEYGWSNVSNSIIHKTSSLLVAKKTHKSEMIQSGRVAGLPSVTLVILSTWLVYHHSHS